MYYDVVCSIYKENENGTDYRVDSRLLCGGFKNENEAMDYINMHNYEKYDDIKTTYACIEIEQHSEDGSVMGVVTVD